MKGQWQQEQSSVRPPLGTVERSGGDPLNNYRAHGSAEEAAAGQAEGAAAETNKPQRTITGSDNVGGGGDSRWDEGNDEMVPSRGIVYRSASVDDVGVSGGGGGGADRALAEKAKPSPYVTGPPSRRWTPVDPSPAKSIPAGASSATAVGTTATTTATTITGATGSARGVVYPIEGLGPAKEIRRPRPPPAIAGPQPWAGQGMKKSSASGAAEAAARELRGVSTPSQSASAGRGPEGDVGGGEMEEQEGSTVDAAALKEAQAKEKENALIQQISEMYELLAKVRDEQEAADGTGYGSPDRQRIILVSRRLPYKLQTTASGSWKAEINNADQALQNFRVVHDKMECLWVGWPGTDVEPGRQNSLMEQLKEHRLVPIFLDPPMEDKFYEGFCKTILWPLFHSSMPTTEDTIASHDVDSVDKQREEGQLWMAYKSVNQSFADAVQDVYRDGDLIWVHDYHLTMVPQMLRSVLPSAKIGFFLHLPFPSSEIYRILPYREAILEGVLSSDLVGFQTYDYARHFLSTVESLLDANCSPQGIEHNGHFANVAICPVGIDPEAVVELCNTPQVTSLMRRLAKQTRGKTMLLGVDSLDATKGLVHKFLALEEMFGMEPDLADRVNFVQVCFTGAQSRERKVLEGQLQKFVARINSKLGSIDEAGPVQYFLDINLHELSALYSIADVLVITPIRDGMNIVPFEYVVSRECRQLPATVVLSEFAGCARSIGGAVLINPWNTTELTQQMIGAINMEEDEREIRHRNMSSYVNNFTATLWCTRFIAQLKEANEGPERTTARLLQKEHVVMSFIYSRWRLLVFNLEGVLARHCALPELVHVPAEAVATLDALSKESKNMVVVKSPRSRETLSRLLGHTNCVLAAEHGAFIRWGKHAQWQSLLPNPDMSWTSDIEPLLEYYTERTPGAVKESRELSRAWHYRDCDLGHGAWQAKQLHVSLIQLSKRLPIHVYAGDKVLEIIPQALMLQVSHFLEIVVLRFRRLLNSKPVEYIPRDLYGSEEKEEDQEQFSSVIAGADVRDFEGYHSGTNSGGAGSIQDCEPGSSNTSIITTTLNMFGGGQQHQQHRTLKLPPLDIEAFPAPGEGGSKGSRGRQRTGKGGSGSKGNRARSASYGGTGSVPREGRQRNRHRRSLSRDALLTRSRSSSLPRISSLHPRLPPEGIFALDVAGLGEWETVKGLGPGVKSPGGWSPRSTDTTSTDAEEASDEEKDADIEFVLVIAGGHDLNDENMFEAMTPPEYNLEDFVHGMEALDNTDEAKVDGERSTPAWTGMGMGSGVGVGVGVGVGGGAILGKTSPRVSGVSSAGFGGGGGGGEGGAGTAPLDGLEPHTTGKKRPTPTIASMGIMGSAMKGNAQTITSLGGTVLTPTPPPRRDGASGSGEKMTAPNETSGNWEDHPTVPPPPMGSPQVRLDSRVSAKSLLYASSSASTVTPDEIDAAKDEKEKEIGGKDVAPDEEGTGERNGRGSAVKVDAYAEDEDEVEIASVTAGLRAAEGRERSEDGLSATATVAVAGRSGSSSRVAKLSKLALERNNGVATSAAAPRPPPSPSAVIATGAMGRRGATTASKKGRGRRETIPNTLFAKLSVRSRSRSPSTGRVDGMGGVVPSSPVAAAAAAAAAAASPGNPEALLLLNDLHPGRRSRTPTPPPPTLRGGIHEALAEADAAAVAARELPPPAETASHQQQLLLQRPTRAHLRESDPPPPPSPPPPSIRRGASFPTLSSMEMPLPPTGSGQEERKEEELEEEKERKGGAGSSLGAMLMGVGGGAGGEGIGLAYLDVARGGRSIVPVGVGFQASGDKKEAYRGGAGAGAPSSRRRREDAVPDDAVREERSLRDAAPDSRDPSPVAGGVEPAGATSGAGAGEALDVSVGNSSASGGKKSAGSTGGGGMGGVSRASVVGRLGTTLATVAATPSPVSVPHLTTSLSTPTLGEQPVLQLGRGSSASSGGGGGNGGGGLGGLVPKKDRRLDISGQNRFIPRKDYPPSSILYQAMRTAYGNDFGSRDLPDTPAACWALVASAQDSKRGARKLSASSTSFGQEHGSFDSSESSREPQSPSSSSGAGATPQKQSSSRLREKPGFGGGDNIRPRTGSEGKVTRSTIGGYGSSGGDGTLEAVRHEIASRQRATATATAAAAVANANSTTDVKATADASDANAAVDISGDSGGTTGESVVVSARFSGSWVGEDEASAMKENMVEEEEEAGSSTSRLSFRGRRKSLDRGSAVIPEAAEPVDVIDAGEGVGEDGRPSRARLATVKLGVESYSDVAAAAAAAAASVDVDGRGPGRDAPVEEGEGGGSGGGDTFVGEGVSGRRERYGVEAWGRAAEPVRWAEHASSTERPSRDGRARDAHYQEQRVANRSRSQSINEAGGHGLDLPINTFSCTVGLKLSQANYYIKSSVAAAALCKELSQIREKEDYTSSVEDYDDGTSAGGRSQPVQYAVANPNTLVTPPQTASASNLADLAIVMGSQFPEDTPGGFAGKLGSLGLPRNDGSIDHSRYSAGLAAGIGYNQNSAGWAFLAQSIQQSSNLAGAPGLDIESPGAGWGPSIVSRSGGRMGRAKSAGTVEDLTFGSKDYRTRVQDEVPMAVKSGPADEQTEKGV